MSSAGESTPLPLPCFKLLVHIQGVAKGVLEYFLHAIQSDSSKISLVSAALESILSERMIRTALCEEQTKRVARALASAVQSSGVLSAAGSNHLSSQLEIVIGKDNKE